MQNEEKSIKIATFRNKSTEIFHISFRLQEVVFAEFVPSQNVLFDKFLVSYYDLTQINFQKFNFHELWLYILLLYGILD